MNDLSVRVPARADYVHVLRSVMAAVAARAKLSVDDIEDLRLALGEACAYLLGQTRSAPAELKLDIGTEPDRLDVVACLRCEDRKPQKPSSQQTVIWHILSALADEARLEETPDGPAIHLTKLLPTS